MLIGAHVRTEEHPLDSARSTGAECLQMFVGPPQSYKKPPPHPEAENLRSSGFPIYVHAPYPINVASPNNRIRIPSRKILAETIERAEEVGAVAVIVHAGHAEDDVKRGFMRWRKVFEEINSPVKILIENTAGGDNAMARHVDVLAELWSHLDEFDPGFCFDTCHAHAAGEDVSTVVQRTLDAAGRIDLVHANGSKDPGGCGRDRHCNFGEGELKTEDILAMVEAADAPAVICETPWRGIEEDIGLLRDAFS